MKENYLCVSVVVFYKNFYFLYSENSENSDHKASAKATQNANQIEDKMKLRFFHCIYYRELSSNSEKTKTVKHRTSMTINVCLLSPVWPLQCEPD